MARNLLKSFPFYSRREGWEVWVEPGPRKIERDSVSFLTAPAERSEVMPKEVIIILDRESNIQWALKTFLEDEGYIVLPVDTVERVIKDFSEFETSALITEYRIDHSSTLEMVRRIREGFPEVYIMMLTDCMLKETEYEEAIQAGVDDLFFKPVSMKKILLHLRKGLNQRSVLLQRNRLKEEMNLTDEREDEQKIRRAKGALSA